MTDIPLPSATTHLLIPFKPTHTSRILSQSQTKKDISTISRVLTDSRVANHQ